VSENDEVTAQALPSCVVNKLMYSVLIINFQGDLLSNFFNFMRIDIR